MQRKSILGACLGLILTWGVSNAQSSYIYNLDNQYRIVIYKPDEKAPILVDGLGRVVVGEPTAPGLYFQKQDKVHVESIEATTKPKPLPYCLVRGYDGKTFSELGKSQTFIDKHYSNIGATVDDTRMWAEFTGCIQKNDKPIEVYGAGALNRGVEIPKTRMNLIIRYNDYQIDAKNTSSFPFFYSPLPVSLQEAEQMASRGFKFYDANLNGNGNQTGFEVGAGTRHKWESPHYKNLRLANRVQFGMQSIENQPRYFRCDTGTVFMGYTHLPALVAKSQSNKSTINTPACWTDKPAANNILLGFYGVEGCVVNSPVIEGATGYKYGIDFNDNGQTDVKTFEVNHPYQEMSQNTAYIRARMRDGVVVVRGGIGHGTGLFIEAVPGLNNSPTNIVVEYLGYWNGVNGKRYKTYANGPSWTFVVSAHTWSGNIGQIDQQFENPNNVSYCGGINFNCGYGKYTAITAPR